MMYVRYHNSSLFSGRKLATVMYLLVFQEKRLLSTSFMWERRSWWLEHNLCSWLPSLAVVCMKLLCRPTLKMLVCESLALHLCAGAPQVQESRSRSQLPFLLRNDSPTMNNSRKLNVQRREQTKAPSLCTKTAAANKGAASEILKCLKILQH